LDQVTQEPPDLIIADVMMPRCDGRSVLQTLRRAGVLMFVTAAPLRHGEVGAPVILKPFDADALLDQVRHLPAITCR
jgi:DNA-binding response OmpR family regulator